MIENEEVIITMEEIYDEYRRRIGVMEEEINRTISSAHSSHSSIWSIELEPSSQLPLVLPSILSSDESGIDSHTNAKTWSTEDTLNYFDVAYDEQSNMGFGEYLTGQQARELAEDDVDSKWLRDGEDEIRKTRALLDEK